MVPQQLHMAPHMWSAFMSYITLMVPHTLYGLGIIWSPTCMYGPPLPYMEQVSYGPPTCTYGCPHVKWLHVLYDSYGPPYLIWNRYHMVLPHVCITSHICDMSKTYGPPYLIWNRHLMVPLTLYGTGIIWCPHIWYDFFQDSFKRGPLGVLMSFSFGNNGIGLFRNLNHISLILK